MRYVYIGFMFYYLHNKILTKYGKRYDFNKSPTAKDNFSAIYRQHVSRPVSGSVTPVSQ